MAVRTPEDKSEKQHATKERLRGLIQNRIDGKVEEPTQEIEGVIQIAEVMPLFKKSKSKIESDRKLIKFVSDRVRYPSRAKEEGIEGKVFIRFVVNTDGSISNPIVLKDIGGDCGKAALEAIEVLKYGRFWTPGYHDGEAVRVFYTLPVTFKLVG